mmetsp:Transcript_22643/g.72435  ORF Transcript_22643/g.72435 Transcript_22643/m.72435 type:complete len:645 (-) Transcript_22643:597-2531(-)
MTMCGARRSLCGLMSLTVLLHVAQIVLYPPLDAASQRSVRQSQPPADALQLARQSQPPSAIEPALLPPLATTAAAVRGGGGGERLMIVTATQPGPCTTRRGDHVLSLALKNKWQFATMHGHGMWLSSELLSPWDLAGQWNKVAVLAALMQPASEARGGASWLLWADDDVLFSDMSFRFPLDQYEAQEAWLVLWGDERMTYELGDSEGVNTGTMLLRVCDWSRALLEAMTRLASSSLRPVLTNHDQGGLVHLLHTAPERWRRHTRLERDYTMNGHWPSYTGAFTLGAATLRSPVWGSSALPVIVHYSGCQMCRGHSFNGTWTDRGVAECVAAFTANYIFADDQSLRRLGLRHTRLGMPGVRPAEGSPLFARHAKLTRCMPRFLVVGTQKGGTSTLHYVLRSGWHPRVALNKGEKEVHHFSLDDNHAMGPARYQARWDGEGAELGTCPGREDEVRGEVSATYLDYPRAAERASTRISLGLSRGIALHRGRCEQARVCAAPLRQGRAAAARACGAPRLLLQHAVAGRGLRQADLDPARLLQGALLARAGQGACRGPFPARRRPQSVGALPNAGRRRPRRVVPRRRFRRQACQSHAARAARDRRVPRSAPSRRAAALAGPLPRAADPLAAQAVQADGGRRVRLSIDVR